MTVRVEKEEGGKKGVPPGASGPGGEEARPAPLLHLIGVDRIDNLPPLSEKILKESELIAGPRRWLDELSFHPAAKLPLKSGLDAWLEELRERSKDLKTAVLASGDPNFYGLAKRLLERVPPERVRITPATTTVQKAFARLKISWADVPVASLHGRGFSRDFFPALLRAGLGTAPGFLAVYTDPLNTPARVAEKILERSLTGWRMIVLENLDLEGERVRTLTLEEAAGETFRALNLLVLERVAPFPAKGMGSREEDFLHEEGMITKSEIRAAALAKLALAGTETLWDVGAGSGAVAIEAAFLLPHGEVYALEKNRERLDQARRNAARYGAANVEFVFGDALSTMKDLPDPDRVFFGGGGEDLGRLVTEARERLNPGGAIVCSVVSLASLNQAVSLLEGPKGPPEVSMIAVSRSQKLAGSFYFKPLNPVYLVKGEFPRT